MKRETDYYLTLPDYKLWPYERHLAALELAGRRLGTGDEVRDALVIVSAQRGAADEALSSLAFFSSFAILEAGYQGGRPTYQAQLEAGAKAARRVESFKHLENAIRAGELVPKGRKESQYASHGLHRYKGKFYPQLTKVLFNYANIQKGAVVLDPFAGSGTTLVECVLNGYEGVGVDLNPLACWIGRAKIESLTLDYDTLADCAEKLLARLRGDSTQPLLQARGEGATLDAIRGALIDVYPGFPGRENLDYLLSWFSPAVLFKLLRIAQHIGHVQDSRVEGIAWTVLSDLLREVSHQNPRDMRVRRRAPVTDAPVLEAFIGRFRDECLQVGAALLVMEESNIKPGKAEMHAADARDLRSVRSDLLSGSQSVDLVLTSPPYATALPYLDTDRLSLAFLGLAGPKQRARLDQLMIGNREIGDRKRESLEQAFLAGEGNLNEDTSALIGTVLRLNKNGRVGFRRRNMAALLYKYFSDMKVTLCEMHRLLKPNSLAIIIVGRNVTVAGGRRIVIDTDRLLQCEAETVGFRMLDAIPITVTTEDVKHVGHSITENSIVVLKRCP